MYESASKRFFQNYALGGSKTVSCVLNSGIKFQSNPTKTFFQNPKQNEIMKSETKRNVSFAKTTIAAFVCGGLIYKEKVMLLDTILKLIIQRIYSNVGYHPVCPEIYYLIRSLTIIYPSLVLTETFKNTVPITL